jgi:hypothetical protein
MQGVTFEGGFVLHLTSLIHSSTQKCKNLSISRKKGGRRVAAAVRPPTAEYGHGGRIRPLLATLYIMHNTFEMVPCQLDDGS